VSNYTQTTNFTAKDSLPSGNPAKVIKGSEFDTEFSAISSAISTKANSSSPTLVTPNIGTPSAGTLTNCTGLPVSTGISGLGSNVATFLATPSSDNLASAVTDETGSGALVFATSPTLSGPTINDGYTEEVYALDTSGSIALNPANGSIQTCALSGNPTFTDSLSSGQSITLMLTNGASYTVTWPTMTWVTSAGDTAPTLTAADTVVFWKISSTLYGSYVGSYV